jgi:hypothetical protein
VPDVRDRRRLVPWVILAVLGLLVAGGAALGAVGNPTGVAGGAAASCPAAGPSGVADYTGMPAGQATSCVAASGATAAPLSVPSGAAKGTVVRQWPDRGASPVITRADVVYLFVSGGPWHAVRQVLPLAVGAPVGDECDLAVVATEDGNARPLTCPGGGVNVSAWDFYAQLRPTLFSAGRHATRRAVLRAYCGLGQPAEIGITGQEMDSVFLLAHVYYGWRLPPPPPAAVTRRGCAAVGAPLGRSG